MKVSLNWIKEFTSVNLPIDKLVDKIGEQLGAVEEVQDIRKKYDGILVVKVVKCEKHPNADRLSLCLVDDGKLNKQVKRTNDGLIEIVCGAPNVKAGMLAAWIPPGATVPSTFEKEPFVIEAREIRGKMSNGMLASPKELDLGDSHEGILALDTGKPGDSFAKTLWLDDYIIDIENKMFTHRPDCFGMLGVAREIAGIQHQVFKSPQWYRPDASLPTDGRKNVFKLAVKNELPDLVPRFCIVAFKDVKVGPSPAWLQSFLARVGVRPINNIVDITNFVMLETGQPLHAYDYDKIKSGVLGVRLSEPGEQLKVIGGKVIKLEHQAAVITDGKDPVGLAGVIGGEDSGTDKDTKNIILEAGTFDMNATRRTAMAYGIFTDAATRFTKGQSLLQNLAAITRAASLIQQIAGGRQASPVIDDKHFKSGIKAVKVTTDFINSRLGLKLLPTEVKQLLENVEFAIKGNSSLEITPPFWRTDIEIPEDIVEEVGRLYGYDKLPQVLPGRDLTPAALNPMIDFKDRVRAILSKAGANEVLTYSFVHGSLMKKVGQDPGNAYEIANALSPDVQYYRLNLTPSLLEKIYPNIRAGFEQFAIFEIGKGHFKDHVDSHKLPIEAERLNLVFSSKVAKVGAPYFAAKRICEYLLDELGIKNPVFEPLEEDKSKTATYYEPGRSAIIKVNSKKIGRIGEYKQSVKAALKLPSYSAGFALDLEALIGLSVLIDYKSLNRFPELEQDLCLRTSVNISYGELTSFVINSLERLSKDLGYKFSVKPLDIYQREEDKAHKQTTWRIILWHPERTLTTEESNRLLDNLSELAKKEINAERI